MSELKPCIFCEGSGYLGAKFPAGTPQALQPIGCCVCHYCGGSGEAKPLPEFEGLITHTWGEYEG